MLVMGGIYVSCTSVTDEITELSLTRCLEPLNLDYTISDGDSVIFSWDLVTGSDKFALQIAKDSCAFTDKDGKLYASVVKDTSISADQVPCGVQLDPDQTYYFRVQAQVSDNSKEFSKWSVFVDSIATYAVRSNLNPKVTGRTATSLTLSWDQDPEVTHIFYTPRDGEQARYNLTADDIKAGSATVSGLTASTNYTVGLYFQSANRGELSLYTMPAFDDTEAVVSDLAGLQAAFADKAPKVKLTMDGSPYELGQVDLLGDMEIYGEEAADGTRPVILGEVHINTTALDHFYSEGVEWNGNEYEFGFPIQIKNGGGLSDVQIGSITYKNSTITGYSKGLIYEWGQSFNLKTYTVDGCTISNILTGSGDGFDLRSTNGTTTVDVINFLNSTIYNSFRSFIRLDEAVVLNTGFNFRNNTLMGLCTTVEGTGNRGIFAFQTESAKGKIRIEDNVFLNMTEFSTFIGANAANLAAADMTIAGNYFYNVAETFFNDKCSESAAIAGGGSVLGSDPCFNSEGLIFNITNSNVLSAGAGDPRWLVEYVEPPIDNELPLIEGTKTWDLTDATIFSGEMKVTQVKDQLRFIVSEENTILLEDGLIKFTAEGVTNPAGAVTAGGLEFHVDKPGSVLIKTADYDDITGNHVVVSLNGTVKGGAATNVNNGNVQKIIITDIAEETPIYLYASGPIAIETLAWSNDTTQVNTALPTPENVKATPATMIQGQATDIVISWDEVENAGSYSISVNNGASETVDGTTYTFPAANTTFLQPGSIPIKVYANPAEGDIYNTQSSAGCAAFAVLSSGGSTDGVTVDNVNDLFAAIASGSKITLKAGTYDFTTTSASGLSEGGVYTVTSDLHLAADGDAVIIGSFEVGSGAGDIILDGINFAGNGESTFIAGAEGASSASITVRNCDITGFSSFINGKASFGDVEITGNYIHDFGNSGGGGFDVREGSITNFTFSNNTIWKGMREFIRFDKALTGLNSVNIVNNTISEIAGGDGNQGYFIRIQAAAASGINVANNLIMNSPQSLGSKSSYVFIHNNTTSNNEGKVTTANNYFYGCNQDGWFSAMDEATATNGGAVLTESPVANAAAGDFTLTNAVLMAKQTGDPRWNPQAEMPPTSSVEVNSMEELVNALSSAASDITLNAGTYNLSDAFEGGQYSVTSPVSLRSNGDATVIGSFKIESGSLFLYGINFNGNGADTFIGGDSGASSESVTVRNCDITGYSRFINGKASFGNIEITGNYIHDFGNSGGGGFDVREGSITNFTFSNNTVWKGMREFIRFDSALTGLNSVNIVNNTISEISGGDDNQGYFIRIQAVAASRINVANNLIMNSPQSLGSKTSYVFIHNNTTSNNEGKVTTSANFFYNCNTGGWFDAMDEATATANGGAVLTASPVADAANGDFTVTDATVKAAGAGDGRWL